MLKKTLLSWIPIKLNRIRGGKNDAYITFAKDIKKNITILIWAKNQA